MKTTAEVADVIPLRASLSMGMGDVRARCFRQGFLFPLTERPPMTVEAFFFPSPVLYHPLSLKLCICQYLCVQA
jgi:hypothetical protein